MAIFGPKAHRTELVQGLPNKAPKEILQLTDSEFSTWLELY